MGSSSARKGALWTLVVFVAGCAMQAPPVKEQNAAAPGARDRVPTAYSRAFSEAESRAACEKAIEVRATYHASGLDVHRFAGYATEIDESGNRRVIQEFTAKNRSGSEVSYRAYCVIQPDGTLTLTMAESTAR